MSSELYEATVDRDTAVSECRENLNFFASIALEDIFKYLYPPIFVAIWQILTEAVKAVRGKTFLAIGIPRGFGKTILLKLYVLYLVLFTDRRFILIVCNTQELAENFLADVVDMLSNVNIVSIFGSWKMALEKDTLKLKKFSFRGRPIIIACAGARTSLRGLNIKFVRPDVIIMDDMQSREEAESVTESTKTITWMFGTLLKAASPERCLYIFVGNMYPFDGSILRKLKYNAAWISFICGAILEDGESIWPELKPVEELLTELENDTSIGHPELFFSEVMNDEEAGTRSGVDISQIIAVPERDIPEFASAGFIIIDPSLGKKKSDDIVTAVVKVYDGVPIVLDIDTAKRSQKELIRFGIGQAIRHNVPAIVIEGTAYQATLAYWFQHFLDQLGITGITPILIYPGHTSKVSRIITMFKSLVKGEIKLSERIRSVVIQQITHYNPLKVASKDDILDTIAYIMQTIIQNRDQIEIQVLANIEDPFSDGDASFSDNLQITF
jgi:hypothetical protein